ncbi:MAG: GNAT family N-acetyltransferase [Candidatus Bathyarchaeia archaeon]|jgi:CelD/BcsL family acetyltransferase involved in cellulose biosynthesis
MPNLVPRSPVSTTVISDVETLVSIEEVWNRIIRECGANPFMLAELLVEFIRLRMREGWHPLLLVLSVDGVPVGVAPLITRKRFGLRFTRFLLASYFSPDFALEDRYRGQCIEQIVQFVFQKLQSDLLELTLPTESPNGGLLKVQCESRNLHYEVQKNTPLGHRLVPIYPSWDAFLSSQRHDFRSAGGELVYLKHQSSVDINRMKRNLNRAGPWRVHYVDDLGKEPDEVQRIHAVEKLSWKEEWRRQRGVTDEDLRAIIKGSIHASASEPSFKCRVCFLELNGQTIAYALIMEYGKLAYCTKTSFAEEYRKLSPGAFIVNESIRALCDNGQVREMDFLTDLPFHKKWPSTMAMRVSVVVSRSRLYRVFSRMLHASDYAYRAFLNMLP